MDHLEKFVEAENFSVALQRVRDGDDEAIAELWNNYFQRLVHLAAKRLPTNLRRSADEEDIALSAFNSFIAGIRRDQFPDLSGPDNLWGLLITLTGRKVSAHLRHQTRQKRGGGAVRGESVFMDAADLQKSAGIGGVSGQPTTPDLNAELQEECERLLDQLPDDQLRQIAVMRMDGFLVDEIADRLQISKRATERRLQLIRRTWSEAVHHEDGTHS
ncbi:RNA polymerase subunit sigma-70 [Roseiconus nitratireducens]|uniref:RNA polymerase subunit sigma-70 n=1 Tax=Roseiconus nitratireducens TaxID=2605748 RepID=A0A5M6CXC6_9BACT|nr:ECF-type sigma factor [Roseiconus nitratireducens]KAA5539877.1 RNA polymerase subunit sigma-70 [Roseiconus nitratireducens]